MAAGQGTDLIADDVGEINGTKYVVNKSLADRVNRLIAEAPAEIRGDLQHAISSGYRDHAQQLAAYDHYLAGGGLAAPPGHSWHERDHGMAVDWNNITPRAWPYLKENAYRYGLGFPLGSKDPYHMQPLETYKPLSLTDNLDAPNETALPMLLAEIRHNESRGNYSNNAAGEKRIVNGVETHQSGAYGFQPATWKTWATRAGFPQYADQPAGSVPGDVQDAVAGYAALHGPGVNTTALWGASAPPGGYPSPTGGSVDIPATKVSPPLPIKPINPVPMIGTQASTGPNSVVVRPAPLTPEAPIRPLPRVSVPHAPNLGSGFANALRTIFRS